MRLPDDLRQALRGLTRARGTSAVIVLTLGLAIGATTTIASFVRGILLARPPFHEPDRLVRIDSVKGGEAGLLSLREVRDLAEQTEVFSGIAVHSGEAGYNVSGEGRPEELPALLVSSNLFEVLGVPLLHGAPWPEKFDRLRNYSLVLGHGAWQRRFGGRKEAVGGSMTLDGAPGYTIHGVLPAGFDYPLGVDLYRSIAFHDLDTEDRLLRAYHAVARLAAGISLERAREEVGALAGRLESSFPDSHRGIRYRLRRLPEVFVGTARPYLLLVFAAVALVLAIACVNVVQLQLARALDRQPEVAIAVALGASRRRVVRRQLVESLLLAGLGGLSGLLLAAAWTPLLAGSVRFELPSWARIEIDGAVLAFTAAVTLGTGLVAGLVPALRTAGIAPARLLRRGGRGSEGARPARLRRGLVIAEVALAFLLLVGANLLVRSFDRLSAVDLGYDPSRLLTFKVALGWKAYREDAQTRAFYDQLLERLVALPGVRGAATNSSPPLGDDERSTVTIEGQSQSEQQGNPYVDRQRVSHAYFELMGVPLLRGRIFGTEDRPETPPVAVVSRRLAERFWPGLDPFGRRLKLGATDSPTPWLTVVGVVSNVRHHDPTDEAGLDLYLSATQLPDNNATVLVRSTVPERSLLAAATGAVWAVDPDQSCYDFATLEEKLAGKTWQLALSRSLFALFGLLAVGLAALGIYGLMSHAARQRRRELALRLALGARRGTLLGRMLGETLQLALAGGAMGLVLALAAGRLVGGLLYEVEPTDPSALAGAFFLSLAVALLAGWLPARRAAATEPMATLRDE